MNSFAEKQKQLKEQAAQQTIYEATLNVISSSRGTGLKMQTIAEAAGIATGTLYNYFKNKVELLTFVDEKLHADILEKMQAVQDLPIDPPEKLRTIIRDIFAFFSQYHLVFDLTEKFGTKLHISRSAKLARLNGAYACIAAIIQDGIEAGQFRPRQVDAAARYFVTLMIGVIEINDWLQDYDLSGEAETLADFVLSNLTNQNV